MKLFNIFRRNKTDTEEVDVGGISIDNPNFWEKFGINLGPISTKGYNSLKENTVFICNKIRSEAVAKLPLKIYKDREEFKKHELYTLLKLRPNKFMTKINFFKCLETQRTIKGNAYAYIERNRRGKITAIYPLQSDNVQVVVDDDYILSAETNLWYIVTDKKGNKLKFFPEEILHFPGDLTLDGIVGIPPIDYIRIIVENGRANQEFINKFLKGGLSIKGIIQYVGDLDEEAKKKFIKGFEEMSNGLKNAHSVSMLPIGYQFQPISLSMADAQFLENCKLNKRELAAIFGVKPHQINDLERGTHNNVAEQQKEFYIETMQSIYQIYEQEMEYKLLSEYEMNQNIYIEFNADSILRGNTKERYEAYAAGIRGMFLTPNDARKKEGLAPEEGGDQLIGNGNLIPLVMAGVQYLKEGDKNGDEGNKKGSK